MYDPQEALAALDTNIVPIAAAFAVVIIAVFVYWLTAWRQTRIHGLYCVPFVGISVFFWHDLSFVLQYDKWFNVYDHWWLKVWWVGLVACIPFESLFLYHVIKYGQKDVLPGLTRTQFITGVLLAHCAIGALFFFFKFLLQDELYFVTFVITAMWSVPFHTGVMVMRGNTKTQSVVMELSTIVMVVCLSYAFSHVAGIFHSPLYFLGVGTYILWSLANVWLILNFPKALEKGGETSAIGRSTDPYPA